MRAWARIEPGLFCRQPRQAGVLCCVARPGITYFAGESGRAPGDEGGLGAEFDAGARLERDVGNGLPGSLLLDGDSHGGRQVDQPDGAGDLDEKGVDPRDGWIGDELAADFAAVVAAEQDAATERRRSDTEHALVVEAANDEVAYRILVLEEERITMELEDPE